MNFFTFTILLFTCCSLSSELCAASDWTLKKDRKGIQAYTKKLENSNFHAFKGQTVMSTSIETLSAVMLDVQGMERWLHTAYDLSLVEQRNENTRVIHMKNKTPTFLIPDRDLVLTQKIERVSENVVIIKLVGEPLAIDEVKGYVRIPMFDGFWKFRKLEDQKTEVTYQGLIDPGGKLPAFVVNLLVVDTPFKSLEKLTKEVTKQ